MVEDTNNYRQLIEVSPVGMFVINREKDIVFANMAAARTFGADSVEQILGQNTVNLLHPDTRVKIQKRREEVFQGIRPPICEYAALRFDGTRFKLDGSEFQSQSRGMQNTWEGKPSILLIIEDVTEKIRVETALRDSELQMRLITDAMPAMIFYIDRDYRVRFANESVADWFGYERDDIIGRHIEEIRGKEAFEASRSHMDKVLIEGIGNTEQGRRFIDGDWRNFEATRVPDIAEDGSIRGYYTLTLDTTERTRVEDELRRTQFALDQGGDAVIWVTDTGGFDYVNDAALRMLGYSRDEFSEMHIWNINLAIPEAQWPSIWARYENRGCSAFEAAHLTKDGRNVPVEVTTTPIDFGGKKVMCSFSRDITERKLIEDRLRQSQKMEAVGQLTGGIAHEFNNLLMVIVGNLERTMDSALDGAARDSLNSAMKGAMRAAELTSQLLSFSRKQDLRAEHIDLNFLVQSMHELLQRTLGETISVDIDLTDGVWPVLADKSQLESVLLNLALNARDAMPNGGRIKISTTNRVTDADLSAKYPTITPGEYTVLEVVDGGIGIAPDILEHVFEPFFTTKDVGEGTGLGLSMIHGFVEQSEGFIDIESRVGKGTSVRIFLPRASGQPGLQMPDSQNDVVLPAVRATILVVEDDPDVRSIVVGILSEFDCVVIEAEDGESALARLDENQNIDVLFTDVVLPGGMSGPDIAGEARNRKPDLKIILTSGYPDGETNELAPDNSQPWFIRKPYRRTDLADLLDQVLQS